MRVYLDGTLTAEQETFLPVSLWFATEDCEDNLTVSETCISLEGIESESFIEGNEFSCRWKGVKLSMLDDNGECITTSDFTLKQFADITKNMRLVNMDVYFDKDTKCQITNFKLVDTKYELTCIEHIDEIEFII